MGSRCLPSDVKPLQDPNEEKKGGRGAGGLAVAYVDPLSTIARQE